MTRYIFLFLACLSFLAGQAQGGYDPENPGDPNPYRNLTLNCSPTNGGHASSYEGKQISVGKEVTCYASANSYFEFVHWAKDGEVVCTDCCYTFTMPDENVELTAVFERNYNPSNPGDPQEAKPAHRVTLTAVPGKGGRFNASVFKMAEGDSVNVYAYPNDGYKFQEWQMNGIVVSRKNPMLVRMTDKDLAFTATFVYEPTSPSEPGLNMFNPATGEMVIDRFEAGRLHSAISNLLGDDYDYGQIQTLVVCGVMQGSDFGAAYRLSNCSKVDISRTNGYSEIPSYAFESASALTELLLPSCVSSIGTEAFSGCDNLSELTCYAIVPPRLASNAFYGLDNSVVIKVPAQSVSLYENADGWKNHTILPADASLYSLTVGLPDDAADGRYRNMNIELLNTGNSQRLRYLITEKTEYTFNNLLSSTSYDATIKNSKNEILGELKGIEIADSDVKVSFENLLQPKTVNVRILTPDRQDVTTDITVKWYDKEGNLLHQGATIAGVLENSEIFYRAALPQNLQEEYLTPAGQTHKVSAQGNALTLVLEAIGKTTLSGVVSDEDGQPVSGAVLAISQCFNEKYNSSATASTNAEGRYEISVSNVPSKVTVSADGYVSQHKELAKADEGLGDLVLAKITGLSIIPSYTFQESSSGEPSEPTEWYSDNSNITYRVEDLTGQELDGCVYQGSSIILPNNYSVGDELNVVAYSKTEKFKEVAQTISLTGKATYVAFPIVEYGGISIKCQNDVEDSICILYNHEGSNVCTAPILDNSAIFSNLLDGSYTVVTMNASPLFNSLLNLSALDGTALLQDKDYLKNVVNVTSGIITEISLTEVPQLDETNLYYTANDGTYFMPNKTQITIGNYLTLKSKVTMKDEYAGKIDAATLIVDIPTSCEFVANSVIAGSGYLGYSIDGNRISIPIAQLGDVVRFCIIPLEGGECKPTAFVKLVIDNEEVLQPIGSAYFEAQNFDLSCPQMTAKTTIAVRGTATSNSEVSVYDNGSLVAKAYSGLNGEWSTKISFVKPYSHSLHELYGEVTTNDGKRLITQTQVVDYDKSYVDLLKVTMVYNGKEIVFDPVTGKTIPATYTFVPSSNDFTFIADFTDNNPAKVSDVTFKVLASDGSIRMLTAEFNEPTKNWVASSAYTDSNKIPVNVMVEYENEYIEVDYPELAQEEDYMLLSALDDFNSTFDPTKVEIETENEQQIKASYFIEEINTRANLLLEKIPFSELENFEEDDISEIVNPDDTRYFTADYEDGNSYVNYYWSQNDTEALKLTLSLADDSSMPNRIVTNYWPFTAESLLQKIWSVNSAWSPTSRFMSSYGVWHNQTINWAKTTLYKIKITINRKNKKCQDGTPKVNDENKKKFTIKGPKEELDKLQFELFGGYSSLAYRQLSQFGRNISFGMVSGLNNKISTTHPLFSDIVTMSIRVAMWKGNITKTKIKIKRKEDVKESENLVAQASKVVHRRKLVKERYNGSDVIMRKSLKEINDSIKTVSKKCKEKDDDDDYKDKGNFPTRPITPSIDPSGYVFEAVPSNRIQGVTATAYYKQQTEDIYGDITETAVVWDAVPFGQENPLITDEQGMYAWDVPAGMWQVKFEKEGYETALSAWLPVPPPQLDVNIAMTQTKQPEVKSVHAYADGVTVEFDKFMLPSTLTFGNIMVSQNEKMVEGTVTLMDLEIDEAGNAYCSKIDFKPADNLAQGEATLFVSKAVKSYANISMSDDFTQSFTVEQRISSIEVVNAIEVPTGSTRTITGRIKPASACIGKTVLISSLNPMLVNVSPAQIELDKTGVFSFNVTGLIVGSADVKISVIDCEAETSVTVNITAAPDENQVATPYASVESGEVEKGTEVYLYCDTEGATIYYTLDGSCPCDINRIEYDGSPLILTENVTLKIMAEKGDLQESEVAEYDYVVTVSGIDEITIDKNLNLYPLPLGEYLNISNSGLLINSISIYDMNGRLALYHNKPAPKMTIKVGSLSPGTYLLDVNTQGKHIVKKVVKK